jgi:hypothetical protein
MPERACGEGGTCRASILIQKPPSCSRTLPSSSRSVSRPGSGLFIDHELYHPLITSVSTCSASNIGCQQRAAKRSATAPRRKIVNDPKAKFVSPLSMPQSCHLLDRYEDVIRNSHDGSTHVQLRCKRSAQSVNNLQSRASCLNDIAHADPRHRFHQHQAVRSRSYDRELGHDQVDPSR